MRKRFLQALEGARRSRPGGPFEVFFINPTITPKGSFSALEIYKN
jgi:hypothetical protein